MEEKTSGIVLNAVNYGDNDKILNVFTLSQGVISAKIKGVKKATAKLKFAGEPFCFAEFIFSKNLDRRVVTSASLIDSFYPLREDIVKYYAGATVLEFIRKFERENIVSNQTFLLTIDTLKKLAYSPDLIEKSVAQFLVNALSLTGYKLDLQGCHKCGENISSGRVFFDYDTGGFYSEQCSDKSFREIHIDTFNALVKIENDMEITQQEGVKALRLLDFYISNKVEECVSSLKELNKLLK